MTKFGSNATNSSATEINLEIFNFFLATEFASFVAGKIIQVIEAMPGSVVPLAMFLEEVLILRSIFWPFKRKLMALSCHILLSNVHGTPWVYDALAKSRHEFSQAPHSHKVVMRWLPFKQELRPNLL